MNIGDQSEPENHQTHGQSQTYVNPVWVQCEGYRCLAYLDDTGKWINFYTGKKLTDFIEIIG